MKVGDLIDYLYTFGNDEEIEIEIHETATRRFVDSTAAVAISDSEFAIAVCRSNYMEAVEMWVCAGSKEWNSKRRKERAAENVLSHDLVAKYRLLCYADIN